MPESVEKGLEAVIIGLGQAANAVNVMGGTIKTQGEEIAATSKQTAEDYKNTI